MYAEVSQLPFSQQMKSINLVDMEGPIEYAQICHRALVDEVTKKQSLKENHINGTSYAPISILHANC